MEKELELFLVNWKRDIQLATKSLSSENNDCGREEIPIEMHVGQNASL